MSIEITPALLSDLRQKAEAYDSKDWFVEDQIVVAGVGYNTEFVAETIAKPDAEYIAAASPAVVLALVAEVERLRGTRKTGIDIVNDWLIREGAKHEPA